MHTLLEQIKRVGLVPVIKLEQPEKALPLAEALAAGGIPVAEITFRAPGADRAIAAVAEGCPDILLGAGTVTTTKQVDEAVAAGAKYIISPGFDPKIVSYCVERNILIVPGCASPGDVSMAARMGLEAVKFFPAEAAGGIKMLRALAGPFADMRFMPTGGIGPENLRDYLAFPRVIACGGSWMVPEKLLAGDQFEAITALAREAVFRMLDVRLDHIGINHRDGNDALHTVEAFAGITGNPVTEIPVSFFAQPSVEVMKAADRGKNGHIAFSVTSVDRAVRFFESQGYTFDYSSRKNYSDGTARFIYFSEEIGGFAVHLTLK
ncbi:MAG: bifunctional 4-hydroxy-2-oxoglutarate aldolase/2-dehydro-3-deoxy-phosphogluconate aldolase [Candidatus Howiella sp.]|jgi:2-dehydro-3-deoxyphosphogluconate aldolase/(4S)-4-hydroxy-2-oxoglutarate aldolase